MRTEFVEKRKLYPIKWLIKNYNNYCFASNKKCYNRITGFEMPLKLKGYTKGYYLNSEFISLKKLKTLIIPYNIIKSTSF